MSIHLGSCKVTDLGRVLSRAASLGYADASKGNAPKTTMEVVRALALAGYRQGHLRAIKAAYTAGRFHQECEHLNNP